MIRKKLNADAERKLIINLITDNHFCKEILPLVDSRYFTIPYAREIAKWVAEYFQQFEKAPGRDIKSIYHHKRATLHDDEVKDAVSVFLASVSAEYETLEPNNIDYEIQTAKTFLKVRSLDVLKNTLETAILENNPEKGEQALANYKRVETISGQGVNILKDAKKIAEALTKENDVLLTFPQALGQLLPPICRSDFVAYFGPAKRGKSFWLWYTSELGMQQQCKVLYITLEMSEHGIIKRSWPSLTGIPNHDRVVHSAYFEKDDDSELFTITQKERLRRGNDPSVDDIEKMQKKLRRMYRKGNVEIMFPTEPLSCAGVEMILDNLYYYENYSPDMVVIDYADYMIPDHNFKNNDNRNIINNIWTGLRRLALKKNIAIVTASHTAKVTFDTDIKTSHASEDIRKINNVTMAIGLNQTIKEKEKNIMRVGLMEIREGRKTSEQAVVLQCLDLGRPCIASKMRNEVQFDAEENEEKQQYARKKH